MTTPQTTEPHNVENPVTFEMARKQLGVSAYYLTALRSHLGITGRVFMLSPIRNFLLTEAGQKFSTFAHYKSSGRKHRLEWKHDGKSYVVTVPGSPDVMAEDRSLSKALAQAGKQLEQLQRAE